MTVALKSATPLSSSSITAAQILIGKKSGLVSIAHKVTELNLDLDSAHFPELLDRVKAQAVEKHRSLTDAEFLALAIEVC